MTQQPGGAEAVDSEGDEEEEGPSGDSAPHTDGWRLGRHKTNLSIQEWQSEKTALAGGGGGTNSHQKLQSSAPSKAFEASMDERRLCMQMWGGKLITAPACQESDCESSRALALGFGPDAESEPEASAQFWRTALPNVD